MKDIFQPYLQANGPVLCLDIGCGTQDALLACPGLEPENWPRFVLPTPAVTIARRVRELTARGRDIWFYGTNMGGGFSQAVREAIAAGHTVSATPAAARAIHDNPARVTGMGVVLTEVCPEGAQPVHLTDYAPAFWQTLFASCGLPQPRLVLAAAQDHGGGNGSRLQWYADHLASDADPRHWLEDVPAPAMDRLRALHMATGGPVADSSVAVLLGALADEAVYARSMRQGITFVNVGNGHLIAMLVYKGKVQGVYEHHTEMLSREQILSQLDEFRRTWLPVEAVQGTGGHGTVYSEPDEEAGGYMPTFILGPRREILAGCGQFIAPCGEMMLAGALGLLWARASLWQQA